MTLDVGADRVGQVVSAAGGWVPRVRYLPIAEHGLIGGLHTVALVGTDGTIDWYCCRASTRRAYSRQSTDADPRRTSPPSSTQPSRFGGIGLATPATADAGARWSIVRRSPSSCSPMRRSGAIRGRPPPACRKCSAAHATGLPLRVDARLCLHALRAAQARVHRGGRGIHAVARRPLPPRRRPRVGPDCRSCTGSMAARTCPRRSSRISRATWASAPVRIGNGAANQLQLDIYGELMDSLYLCNKYGLPIYHDGWVELCRNLEWLVEHWDQPDEGIRETRAGRKDYTYSRLMSWVAVERAIRVARQRGLPADISRWSVVRDRIYTQIMERGWHPAAKRSSSTTTATCSTPPCCSCLCASSSRPRIRAGSPR